MRVVEGADYLAGTEQALGMKGKRDTAGKSVESGSSLKRSERRAAVDERGTNRGMSGNKGQYGHEKELSIHLGRAGPKH